MTSRLYFGHHLGDSGILEIIIVISDKGNVLRACARSDTSPAPRQTLQDEDEITNADEEPLPADQ